MRVDSRSEYLRISGHSAVAPLKLGRNIWIFGGRVRMLVGGARKPRPTSFPSCLIVEDKSMLHMGVCLLPGASVL